MSISVPGRALRCLVGAELDVQRLLRHREEVPELLAVDLEVAAARGEGPVEALLLLQRAEEHVHGARRHLEERSMHGFKGGLGSSLCSEGYYRVFDGVSRRLRLWPISGALLCV